MAVEIPRDLIQYILLGSGDSQRHIQDSPILCDVWVSYAEKPSEPADLLITSHQDGTATELAVEIYKGITRPDGKNDPQIGTLQAFVAARLYFGEVLKILVPLTTWWQEAETKEEFEKYNSIDSPELDRTVDHVKKLRDHWLDSTSTNDRRPDNTMSAFERFVALCTLVALSGLDDMHKKPDDALQLDPGAAVTQPEAVEERQALERMEAVQRLQKASRDVIAETVFGFLQTMHPEHTPLVWQISLNRPAAAAIEKSVTTVKADAARRVFELDSSKINWAVIDSGIDTKHPAFVERVKATYDFTHYRQIVSLGNDKDAVREANLAILKDATNGNLPSDPEVKLKQIAEDGIAGRPVRWDLVTEFVKLPAPPEPASQHGTHVAGIIGAAKYDDNAKSADGMCPGIGLYDFRILTGDIKTTEFAVIAALQFIRFMNERAGRLVINGVNMSLSIPHNVKNFACGRTPVCNESERLIDSGVVVVAAAGNFGYNESVIGGQAFNTYQDLSITDPGNADRVITVGSTHRASPFTYGISYFSSRGPTGDGRLKPDLVAPGECIYSTLPKGRWGRLDGTSMAAPHVSGAAAMLMARYPELIGKPDRIKRILCETATDLGRERNFQGHGLLDVLRALQSQ
jgi:serine protease AprX